MKHAVIIGLAMLFSTFGFAQESTSQSSEDTSPVAYNMYLLKIGKNKRYRIEQGDRLKVKAGFNKFNGRFYKMQNNKLYFLTKGDTVKVPLSQLTMLKRRRDPLTKTLGIVVGTAGVATMVAGPIVTGIGIYMKSDGFQEKADPSSGDEVDRAASFAIGGGIALIPAGYGIFRLGKAMCGRKFAIHSKYKVQPIEQGGVE